MFAPREFRNLVTNVWRELRRNRTTLVLVGPLLCVAGFLPEAWAMDSFRCHDTGRLVQTGDGRHAVVSKCREPDSISQRTVQRKVRRGAYRNGYFVGEEVVVEVIVEEWTFDFGKNRLLVFAQFEQDHLVSIGTGGYGERE